MTPPISLLATRCYRIVAYTLDDPPPELVILRGKPYAAPDRAPISKLLAWGFDIGPNTGHVVIQVRHRGVRWYGALMQQHDIHAWCIATVEVMWFRSLDSIRAVMQMTDWPQPRRGPVRGKCYTRVPVLYPKHGL